MNEHAVVIQRQQEAYRFLIAQEEILRDRCYTETKQCFVKTHILANKYIKM